MGVCPEGGRPSGRGHPCGQGATSPAAIRLLHGGVLVGHVLPLGRGCAPVAVEVLVPPAALGALGLPEALAGHPVVHSTFMRVSFSTRHVL